MAEDFINYGALIDEAMHIIVKKSLQTITHTNKLPGEHHFFISFLTHFKGVIISERLRRRYPQEMTIVLQYQFEGLEVNDRWFSVILSFDSIKEKIIIPFAALTAFADPSVKFGLQFRHMDETFGDEKVENLHPVHSSGNVAPLSDKNISEAIRESGATNVITLDSFRKKND